MLTPERAELNGLPRQQGQVTRPLSELLERRPELVEVGLARFLLQAVTG